MDFLFFPGLRVFPSLRGQLAVGLVSVRMAEGRDSTAAAVSVLLLLLCVVLSANCSRAAVLKDGGGDDDRSVPLYIRKARLYLQRQQAYERTMQGRLSTLARAMDAFSSDLYLQHVQQASSHANVLLSPLSAFVSLAMALPASRGLTKRQVLNAMRLSGRRHKGIHSSLQRALQTLLEDDTDAVDSDMDLSGELMQGDDPGLDLSVRDLEELIRNDYLVDSSISYNPGQAHIKYGTAVRRPSPGFMINDAPPPPEASSKSSPDLFIRIANGMFHSEQVALSQHFSNRLVSLYGAPPMAMQQGQPEVSVNLWVDAVTRGLVPDMLTAESVDNETLLVLVNAMSFWGSWQHNFPVPDMVPIEFQTQAGDSVNVQCLYRTGNYSVKELPQLGAEVLELPYSNTRYSLYVFLPRPKTGLDGLERGLKKHKLGSLLQDMPPPSTTIVLLPKFHLRSRVSLSAELRRQGVHRLFRRRKADLRRMTDEERSRLYVNDLYQYAALEVNDGASSDAARNFVTIGSGWDSSPGSSVLDSTSYNTSVPDSDSVSELVNEGGHSDVELVDGKEDGDNNEDDDYDSDYHEDYYEDYDEEGKGEFGNYFIAERPFFFVVKDKQHDLVLLMGRVTNPLP